MKLIILLFSLLATLNAKTQTSLLWKVSGNGMTTPSYIFGTLHACDSNDIGVPKLIFDLIDRPEGLAVEIDVTDMKTTSKVIQSVMLEKNEKATNEILNSIDYVKLLKMINSAKDLAPLKTIMKQFKPGFILFNLTVANQLKGIDANYFMDVTLIEYAKKKKLKVGQLETAEEQVKEIRMASLNPDKTGRKIVNEVNVYFSKEKPSDKVFENYRKQDYDNLLSDKEFESLQGRNKQLVKRMDSLMKTNPYVFCVGAVHLSRRWGIVEQLKLKGYELTPLNVNVDSRRAGYERMVNKLIARIIRQINKGFLGFFLD